MREIKGGSGGGGAKERKIESYEVRERERERERERGGGGGGGEGGKKKITKANHFPLNFGPAIRCIETLCFYFLVASGERQSNHGNRGISLKLGKSVRV